MPLVMLCGYPCAGKSTLAHHLAAHLQQHRPGTPVHIVSEDALLPADAPHPAKDALYTPAQEKKTRAALLAAAERHLSRDAVVIVDWLCYMKSFRYQLHCQARAAHTASLLLHCQTRPQTCHRWNRARTPPAPAYSPALLEDLCARFEEPNGQNRWDAPLHCIAWEDAAPPELHALLTRLLPDIFATPSKGPSPATATASPTTTTPHAPAASLQELDARTHAILAAILTAQQQGLPRYAHPAPSAPVLPLALLPRPLTAPQLARIRRHFLALYRIQPVDPARIDALFLDFILSNVLVQQ